MNVPQGYKQTELGIIPEDWEVVTVDDVLDMPTKTTSTTSFLSKYYVGTENMYSLKKGIAPHLGRLPYMQVREYQINDILVSNIRPYLKKIWLANRRGGCSSDVIVFRVKDTEIHFSAYIYTVLSDDSFFKYVMDSAIGTKMPRGDKAAIKAYSLTIPKDIAEQRAIAEALSDVDGLIAALDKKIAKKRLLKQGAMQQLLTGKKRLPGFTDEWVEKPIRLLCKLYGRIGFRGYTKADLVNKGEGAITFSPSDIHDQVISYTNCDYISWRKYDESPEIQVFNGDIIFCKTASIGKCAIIKILSEKATINPQFVVLKDFKCNNEWLYYSIIDRKFQTVVNGITGGSTIPTMSQEKLYEQTLLCPPTIEEQQAIATILSDMDKEIADLEAQRDKYRLLKSGMMQKLLTGQIRLKTE